MDSQKICSVPIQSFGLGGGIRSGFYMVQSLDNTDPQFNTDLRETKPNVGLAMMFYSENYYVAVSAPELTINVSNSNAP